MYNITLICTAHKEIGRCNSIELYKIIESINPDIIFEEMTPDLFDRVYKENQFSEETWRPEAKSIKRYLQIYDIKHFPVDIDIAENVSVSDFNRMNRRFYRYDIYKELYDEDWLNMGRGGFSYLNSKECEDMTDKMKGAEKELVYSIINQDYLIDFYELVCKEFENRENSMLRNIYNYSKEHSFNNAIFMIGATHRKSIIEKIENYKKQENIKLNWTFYGN